MYPDVDFLYGFIDTLYLRPDVADITAFGEDTIFVFTVVPVSSSILYPVAPADAAHLKDIAFEVPAVCLIVE